MKLDKFTQKSQEALFQAQQIASDLKHQAIEPAHLLFALLRQEDGVVPAVVTLAVTLLRLVGELQGWSPRFFSKEAGGGGALVGIAWLVPVFGAWFGWRLARSGERAGGLGRALGLRRPGRVRGAPSPTCRSTRCRRW